MMSRPKVDGIVNHLRTLAFVILISSEFFESAKLYGGSERRLGVLNFNLKRRHIRFNVFGWAKWIMQNLNYNF